MPNPDIDGPIARRGGWIAGWFDLPSNVRGGLLYIVGLAVFAVVIGLIKLAGEGLHVTQILFVRQITMVVLTVPLIVTGWPRSIQTAYPGLQAFRIIIAFLAMYIGFSAVLHLELAELTLITFSKAFFTTLLAILFLREVVQLPRWIAVVLGFVGVLIVVWPEDGQFIGLWHLAALASAVCVSIVTVSMRVLAQVDTPVSVLAYQALGVGLLLTPLAIWFWESPTVYEWALLASIGALSVVAQYLSIIAMKAGEASAIAPLEYTLLVFTTALGWWLFGEWPGLQDWIGAAIIIGAAIYVLRRERASSDPNGPDGAP